MDVPSVFLDEVMDEDLGEQQVLDDSDFTDEFCDQDAMQDEILDSFSAKIVAKLQGSSSQQRP